MVNERRQVLDAAMRPVEQASDPQTDAAIRMVAWVTGAGPPGAAPATSICGASPLRGPARCEQHET